MTSNQHHCIDNSDPNNPVFKIDIAGASYVCSLQYVQEDKRNSLANMLAEHMQEIHRRATRIEKRRMQLGIKDILGIGRDL